MIKNLHVFLFNFLIKIVKMKQNRTFLNSIFEMIALSVLLKHATFYLMIMYRLYNLVQPQPSCILYNDI